MSQHTIEDFVQPGEHLLSIRMDPRIADFVVSFDGESDPAGLSRQQVEEHFYGLLRIHRPELAGCVIEEVRRAGESERYILRVAHGSLPPVLGGFKVPAFSMIGPRPLTFLSGLVVSNASLKSDTVRDLPENVIARAREQLQSDGIVRAFEKSPRHVLFFNPAGEYPPVNSAAFLKPENWFVESVEGPDEPPKPVDDPNESSLDFFRRTMGAPPNDA